MPKESVSVAPGSFSETLLFAGTLDAAGRTATVERLTVTVVSHEYPRDLTVTCELSAADAHFMDALPAAVHELVFSGEWERTGSAIMVQRPQARIVFRPTSWSAAEIKGEALTIDTDVERLQRTPASQRISAEFTPTDVALPAVDHVVRFGSGEEYPLLGEKGRPPFRISSGVGELELSVWYKRERVLVSGTAAEVLVPSVGVNRTLCVDEYHPALFTIGVRGSAR